MQRLKASCSGLGTVCAAVLLAIVLSVPVQCQIISTAAGSTSWGWVEDVTFDAQGNMYVPDYYNQVVYKVDTLASFTVIAGSGTGGYSGDGAQATAAKISGPIATVVDSNGNLYIAEYTGHRIRKVASNGIITTFAGTGRGGFSGDGGAATSAQIYYPLDLLVDKNGNILLIDGGNNRIRQISPDGIITTIAGTGRRAYGGDGGLARAADMFPSAFNFGPDGVFISPITPIAAVAPRRGSARSRRTASSRRSQGTGPEAFRATAVRRLRRNSGRRTGWPSTARVLSTSQTSTAAGSARSRPTGL